MKEEVDLEIKFEITEEDYINFNLHHVGDSPSQKKTYNILRYLLPIICTIPIYSIGTVLFKQPKVYWAIIAILFLLIWIITYPKQHTKLITREAKKMLKEGDNSSIFGDKTMIIDKETMKVFNETSSETTSRSSIKDIKLYDDMILIYLNSITAEIVPTRCLDENQKNFLIEDLKI